jgi:hypothetical protein
MYPEYYFMVAVLERILASTSAQDMSTMGLLGATGFGCAKAGDRIRTGDCLVGNQELYR